jgi:hypothetical protein
MSDSSAKPTLWYVSLGAGYVALTLVLYPALLISLQDFPSIPQINFARYFESVTLTYFWEETIVFTAGFCFIFLSAYAALFATRLRRQFVGLATVLSVIGYSAGIYVLSKADFLVCAPALQRCVPLIAHAFVTTFSILIAIVLAERLLFRVLGESPFDYPSERFRARDFASILYLLLAIIVYPTIVMFVRSFPNFPSMHMLRYFERTEISYLSLQYTVLTISFLVVYVGLFTLLFVKTWRAATIVAVSLLSFLIFSIASYLDCSLIRSNVCHPTGWSVSLRLSDQGALIGFAIMCSIVLVARLFKRFGYEIL